SIVMRQRATAETPGEKTSRGYCHALRKCFNNKLKSGLAKRKNRSRRAITERFSDSNSSAQLGQRCFERRNVSDGNSLHSSPDTADEPRQDLAWTKFEAQIATESIKDILNAWRPSNRPRDLSRQGFPDFVSAIYRSRSNIRNDGCGRL